MDKAQLKSCNAVHNTSLRDTYNITGIMPQNVSISPDMADLGALLFGSQSKSSKMHVWKVATNPRKGNIESTEFADSSHSPHITLVNQNFQQKVRDRINVLKNNLLGYLEANMARYFFCRMNFCLPKGSPNTVDYTAAL